VDAQQSFEIALIAREDHITVIGEQRDVCVDHIVEPRAGAEFTDRP
jgi:hypothetical protein